MSWIDSLQPTSSQDKFLRLFAVAVLIIWNWQISTSLSTPYPKALVEAYSIPLTRIALLSFVVLSALWCPSVGILAAFAYIALGADVLFFTNQS
jgi:hypothetical protein